MTTHRPAPRTLNASNDRSDPVPGSLVIVKGHDVPVVVEGLRHTSFGVLAQCCGFKPDDRVWIEDVPLAQLRVCGDPASVPDLQTGSEVRLRPSGPVMTVLRLDGEGGALRAVCEWDSPGGGVRQRAFPVTGLTLGLLSAF